MSSLTIGLVFGYFVLCIGLALFLDYRSKKKRESVTAQSYATGRGSMGLWLVFSLMAGNVISGSYVVGNTSSIIQYDVGYLWTFYAYVIGWALTIAYIPIYRAAWYKYGASSLGEVFKAYYGPRVSVCITSMIFIAFAGAVSAQMNIVAGLLQSLLGLDRTVCIVVTIAALTGIALMGGMKGLAKVNLLHTAVLSISVVVMLVLMITAIKGDFGQVVETLKPTGTFTLIGGSRSLGYVIGTLCVQPFVCVVSALSVAGTFGAKSTKIARDAQIMLPIFAVLFFGSIITIAICGKYLWPDMEPATAWYTMAGHFGPFVAALASCGVLAASMSTAPSQIMLMAGSAVEFYRPHAKGTLTEAAQVRLTKTLVVVCGVGFQLLGLLSNDIVNIMSNAYTVWAICGLVLTISILWKRPNEQAVFFSMVLGMLVCVIWIIYGYAVGGVPFGINITYAAGGVAVVTEIGVTLATAAKGPSDCYLRYQEARVALKQAVAEGREQEEAPAEAVQ